MRDNIPGFLLLFGLLVSSPAFGQIYKVRPVGPPGQTGPSKPLGPSGRPGPTEPSGGGTGFYNNLINVKDPAYAAKGDDSTDDTAAIQSAINAACAAAVKFSHSAPAVLLPTGRYATSFPIIVNCAYPLTIFGTGPESSILVGNSVATSPFPLIWREGADYMSHLGTIIGPSLATGAGSSLDWPNSDSGPPLYFYQLTDALTVGAGAFQSGAPLNGMKALSIEGFFNLSGVSAGHTYTIVTSLKQARTANHSLAIAVVQGVPNTIRFCLNTSVSGYQCISGGSIFTRTTYEYELSYDGSDLRGFVGVPGGTTTLVGTRAMTGAIVQQPYEEFTYGYSRDSIYDGVHLQWRGSLDSLRISTVARHTSTYRAPPTKFGTDSRTSLLMNNTATRDAFLKVDYAFGATGPDWIPAWSNSLGAYVKGDTIRDLGFSGGSYALAFSNGISTGLMSNLDIQRTMSEGVRLSNESFNWLLSKVDITPSGYSRACLEMDSSGGSVMDRCECDAGGLDGLILDDSGLTATGLYMLTGGGKTVGDIYIDDVVNGYGVYVFNNLAIDTENGGNALIVDVEGQAGAVFNGGLISGNVTGPLINANGSQGVILTGTGLNAAASEIVHCSFPTNLQAPVLIQGGTYNGSSMSEAAGAGTPISRTCPYQLTPTLRTTVANLPVCTATVNHGGSVDVTDCDSCTFGATCVHTSGTTYCHEICTNAGVWVAQ